MTIDAPPVVAPQANPPITIGPFTNVPAPGSPIRSDWPQSISQYAWDTRAHHTELFSGAGAHTTNPISAIGMYDMSGLVSVGGAAVTARTTVTVVLWAGASGVDWGVGVDIVRLDTGQVAAQSPRPGRVWAAGAAYYPFTLSTSWLVTSGLECGYKIRFEVVSMSAAGSINALANSIYRVQAT